MHHLMRSTLVRRCRSFSDVAHLKRSAAMAFTEFHARDLNARLLSKCKDQTTIDQSLQRAAACFTLQYADIQRCRVGEVIAEVTQKSFLTPVGQLHFQWSCCFSQMPMELPLRWSCALLLRPLDGSGWAPHPADPAWSEDGFATLVAGEMFPDTRGPPSTSCEDEQGLASLLAAMETASRCTDDDSTDASLARRDCEWLLSFMCGEPSDFAFDSLSGTLSAHV